MNVNCNKCGKRYVIADDKIAGKTSVKIRCKQCQNLIQVAGPAAAAGGAYTGSASIEVQASSASSIQSVEPPPPAGDQWFAMIAGKQEGPFELSALAPKVSAGEVTPRTYVWKPGMDGWKRAAEVPEVSPLLTPTVKASMPSRPPPPAPKTDTAVAPEKPVAKAPATNGHKADGGVLGDLFNDVGISGLRAAHTPSGVQKAEPAKAAPTASSPSAAFFASSGSSTASSATAAAEPSVEPTADTGSNDAGAEAPVGSDSNPVDPFAALQDPSATSGPQPMGEATKFFIAQAGVNKRNPPWKIALFVLSVVVAPATLLYLLSTLKVLPTVTVTTEDGREVQEEFFSPSGITGLKDLLTGDQAKKKAEAEAARKAKEAAAAAAAKARAAALAAKGETKAGDPVPDEPVAPPKPNDAALAAFYGEDVGKKTRVPKDRNGDNPSGPVNASGLSNDAAMKIIADKKKSFDQCIEAALRRNPNLAVGNITVTLTVGASGAVKAVGVTPKKHEGSDWAQCMMLAGKRIIFPTSDGDTDIEVPLKVGVAL